MKDPFLVKLVNLVHNNDLTFGITLNTEGGVVSGTLISTKEYFDRFARSFSNAWPGGPNEVIRSSFAAWGDKRGSALDSVEGVDDPFIHLKNARLLMDGVSSGSAGVLWRGKLEEVVGFTLGHE